MEDSNHEDLMTIRTMDNVPIPADASQPLVSRLNGRTFVTTGNDHGLSTAETSFRYFVEGMIITGEYQGGEIVVGKIVGKATGPATIELLFQCVSADGKLICGQSSGHIGINNNGFVTLDFEWSWLTDDRSSGRSSYIEIQN